MSNTRARKARDKLLARFCQPSPEYLARVYGIKENRMAKQEKCKATDLGSLQEQVEVAARKLKAAKTAVANTNAAYDRACEAYGIAQKALVAGVEQIQIATKVS